LKLTPAASIWPKTSPPLLHLLFFTCNVYVPFYSGTRDWNIGNIGILSRFCGLDASFRKKIIQLFDLGYASRLRLVFLVSTGFFLCYALIGTTVEIRIEAEEEEEVNFNYCLI
jgi:hypothetical protein